MSDQPFTSQDPAFSSLIKGSKKLIEVFGYWPSFHDAEIMDIHFSRGEVDPERDRYIFPILTVKLLVSELTREKDAKGFLFLLPRLHTLTTLRFHDVNEDFTMDGFNHVNQITELFIAQQARGTFTNGEPLPPYYVVELKRGFGVSASFRCMGVEVLDAVPTLPSANRDACP
ncbi:MAG: Imm50 family immunity protein [Chthoniobacterales bacterium]